MIERLVRNEAPSLLDTEKANELIDAINGLFNSRGANGISVKKNQDGSLLIGLGDQDEISAKYKPFEVIEVSEEKVRINPGLVNGVLVSSVSVNNSDGTNYLCLEIEGDTEGITSVNLVLESSPPDGVPFEENGINTSFKYVIAIVSESGLISQIVNTNLFFSVEIAAEIPKESVEAGEYPNNIYYTWRQSL